MTYKTFLFEGAAGLGRGWIWGLRSGRVGCSVFLAGLLCLSQPVLAIQKETTTEKAEHLQQQVKGGLFNFWDFDKQSPDTVPEGFVATTYGEGSQGTWKIRPEATAPSTPNIVFAESSCGKCSQLLIAEGLGYEYPDLAVRLRQGKGTGSVGVVFGHQDPMNFYAAIVDFPAKKLRVIRVVKGQESVLGEAALKTKPVEWHMLRVQRNTIISKDIIETFFDGQITVSVQDQTLGLGQVGLLVRGDVAVQFDSFHAAPLYSQRPLSPPAAY